jgi:membrane protein YqaA with SNARE-associated domain
MRVFSRLYEWVLRLSRHNKAPYYLSGLSFAESSFFPIPPDVMLAPMSLAQPKNAIWFATLTTLASVVGGVAGYLIGMLAFDLVEPLLHQYGYYDRYLRAVDWFDAWGFWAIFLAGFSPIPYKIFTITAGAISMAFLPFMIASMIGRGGRFFLVAMLMAWGGESMEEKLRHIVDWLGWGVVVLVVAGVAVYKLTGSA